MNTHAYSNDTKKRMSHEQEYQKKVCMHVLRAALYDVRAMRAATALIAAGFDVTIIDTDSTQRKSIRENIQGICMHHITVPASFRATRFERWSLIKAIVLFIRCTIKVFKEHADIYHASEVTALPACYLAARIHNKPIVFEAYELPLQDRPLREMGKGRRLVHALMTRFLAHALPRCTAVITVSQPIIQEIQRRYHVPKVQLLRNFPTYQKVPRTNRLRQLLGLNPEVRIALYQGYLQPDRGLERLVHAAAFLNSNVVIVMMGQGVGNTQSDLEALIETEGVEDRVKIIPAVPYEELLSWTTSADIGLAVIPLDYTINMRMALPNKFFEYLMAGLPVLSSSLEAIMEVITTYDVGQVVPSMDPITIGNAINLLIHDEYTLARMRKNALQAAQTLCWERESSYLVRLYQDITSV